MHARSINSKEDKETKQPEIITMIQKKLLTAEHPVLEQIKLKCVRPFTIMPRYNLWKMVWCEMPKQQHRVVMTHHRPHKSHPKLLSQKTTNVISRGRMKTSSCHKLTEIAFHGHFMCQARLELISSKSLKIVNCPTDNGDCIILTLPFHNFKPHEKHALGHGLQARSGMM